MFGPELHVALGDERVMAAEAIAYELGSMNLLTIGGLQVVNVLLQLASAYFREEVLCLVFTLRTQIVLLSLR